VSALGDEICEWADMTSEQRVQLMHFV